MSPIQQRAVLRDYANKAKKLHQPCLIVRIIQTMGRGFQAGNTIGEWPRVK